MAGCPLDLPPGTKQHPVHDWLMVSPCGRIFSLKSGPKRYGYEFNQCRHVRTGRMAVSVGSGKRPVHRLVAETHVPGQGPGLEINHIDGDKMNNRAENLEWVEPAHNTQHALRHKLIPTKSVIVVYPDGSEEWYTSQREAARALGVDRANIARAIREPHKRLKGCCFRDGT